MRFRKGKGRTSKKDWWWRGKKIEEVKEFTYLGYRLQKNGRQDAQVKGKTRKAAMILGKVCRIGKRGFGKDWSRRIWLFDKLIWMVISYGVEVWEWKEREEVKRLEERYLRWVFGLDSKMPSYLIREETKRNKLRERTGERAWSFEKKLERGKGSELTRICWKEMRERSRDGRIGSDCEGKEKNFLKTGSGM